MRSLWSTIAFGFLLLPPLAWGDQSPNPPQGPLWTVQPNGDAVQNDLGFIVPKKWKNFDREGFTSTRADGASTKAHYLSEDKALRLGILLQFRPDVRGLELAPDFLWTLVQASAEFEYVGRSKAKPTEISSGEFSLGKRIPPGYMRWAKYELDNGMTDLQGVWFQNIGVWTVVITMSGPESRKGDIEAAADTLLTEMPFPRAPLAAELAAVGQKTFASLPKCAEERPAGQGKEITPGLQEVAALGILTPGLVFSGASDAVISPVNHAQDYCLIETFYPRKDFAVVAVQYMGAATSAVEARYGFALANGRGGYYQLERLAGGESLKGITGASDKHVYLNFSNNKRGSVFAVYDEWPGYEAVKQLIVSMHDEEKKKREPVMTMTHPAEKAVVVTNPERIQKQ